MDLKRTSRGFLHADFTDLYGEACSIQDSSLATADAIWLGIEHINAREMASVVGIDLERIPARMHLSRELVAELLPLLQRFVETGSIGDVDQPPAQEKRCLNCGNLIGLLAYSAVYCSAACADEHKDGRERAREGTT